MTHFGSTHPHADRKPRRDRRRRCSEGGALDLPALRKLIDLHVANGTAGIVDRRHDRRIADRRRRRALPAHQDRRRARRAGASRSIAGTGANSTAEAIELTAYAKKAGADSALSVVPYYNKPTQEGLYRHFRTIAEARRPADDPLQRAGPHGRRSRHRDDAAPRRGAAASSASRTRPPTSAAAASSCKALDGSGHARLRRLQRRRHHRACR